MRRFLIHFTGTKLNFAHTWNEDDDTILPTPLGLLAKVVADRTSNEAIMINASVYRTAFNIIEQMVNTHYKQHQTTNKNEIDLNAATATTSKEQGKYSKRRCEQM